MSNIYIYTGIYIKETTPLYLKVPKKLFKNVPGSCESFKTLTATRGQELDQPPIGANQLKRQ